MFDHLYIGTGKRSDVTVNERGEYGAEGFFKIQGGDSDGSVFTYAFVSEEDAKKFYGAGNYRKVDIIESGEVNG